LPWCVEQGIEGFGPLSDLLLVVVAIRVGVVDPRMMIDGT